MQYYDSITDDKIYVVAADKGFRKSFKERDEFVTFFDLNGFKFCYFTDRSFGG